MNPVHCPTHVSGTTLDVILTERGGSLGTVNVSAHGEVAMSDHSFIDTVAPLSTDCSYAAGVGRLARSGWTRSNSLIRASNVSHQLLIKFRVRSGSWT